MNKKERRKRVKPKKKKITINQEFSKDEADVRALMKSREKSIPSNSEPNSDIEADFFCQTNPEADDSDDKSIDTDKSKTTKDSDSNLPESRTPRPASTYVNIDEVSPICPVETAKVSKDAELLFVPSSDKLLAQDKLKDRRTANLEDQGLYVDYYQLSEGRNFNRLVNRFLEEDFQGDLQDVVNVRKATDTAVYKSFSDVNFEPIYCPPKPIHREVCGSVRKSVIVVYIKELVFTDHPIFTEEIRLAVKLNSLYDIYKNLLQENRISPLSSELSTLRGIFADLLDANLKSDKAKIGNHIAKIRTLRTELHNQERLLKIATFDCISSWKNLKSLRKKQGYSYTDLKLSIKLIEKDFENAEQLWNERFEVELNEMIREAFETYYKDKKRIQKGKSSSGVRKPNLDEIKDELTEIFKIDLIGPKEPEVALELTRSEGQVKRLEKLKEYSIKVLFDKILVSCCKTAILTNSFAVRIEECFAVCLEANVPELIEFQVCEKSALLPDTKIAELRLVLPHKDSFKLSKQLKFRHQSAPISGHLKVCLSCNEKAITNQILSDRNTIIRNGKKLTIFENLPGIEYDQDAGSDSESTPKSSVSEIEPIPSASKLKHDDVNNDTDNDDDEDYSTDYFTFTEDLYTFLSKDDFDNDKRFNMLIARYKNDLKFKDKRFIPTFAKELENGGDNDEGLTRTNGGNSQVKAIDEMEWFDRIDIDKHRGKKYIKNLYDVVLNHCERLNRNEDARDLLIGDEVPTFSSILSSFMEIFGTNRPLKPAKSSQLASMTTVVGFGSFSKFNIIVNVMRATGVPFRQFAASVSSLSRRSSTASLTYQVLKPSNVRPYVTVRCKDKMLRTVSAEGGSNPTWNEQLVLPISRDSLESKDDIVFELYDEYIEDLLNDELSRASEVYQRIHTNWLGELRFSLNTIFTRQQIEGVFQLNSPKILLGYTRPSLESGTVAGSITIENIPEIKNAAYLTLYMNVEPFFEIPKTTMSHLECSELRELKIYIQNICIEVKTQFPDRFIDPLISLVNGKRVCITRLLEPIPLPFGTTEHSETMIRRYVSLFPIFQTTNSCAGLQGVWFSNQIILDASWASAKDLGVLLCCFYLALEIPAALVLGIADPHGESSFVLLKQSSEYILVDPTTGRKYSSKDAFCPMVKVFCIVRNDNIYYNIQLESRVSMTDFNVENSANWLSVFNKKYSAPNGEIHNLNYLCRDPYETGNLQKTIERKIIKKINSWRSNRKTVWNRAFKDFLYNVLIELERDTLFDREETVYADRILQSYPNYKIFGFTQNFSYTNLSSISDRIKVTGIHLNTDKNVEFSLATYIQQYPNNILSVWIFIMSAIPTKNL